MSDQRTVLITGCSSGFGLGLATAFQARGWHVIAGLRDTSQVPRELGAARLVRLDLEDDTQIAEAAAGIDRLDCLVNNAGYALTGPFAGYAAAQMRRQMQVNLLGPALLTQTLLPALKRSGGRVINISSIAGQVGMPMNSMYCAAKHAMEGLTESLRHEFAPHGVQVALVEPGGFRTRFADNMAWGKQDAPLDRIDQKQLANYQAMRERLMAGPGRDPAPVVAAIVKLAEMKTMPLGTRIGTDARLLWGIKRWLPESLGVALIGAAFRRRLSNGKK